MTDDRAVVARGGMAAAHAQIVNCIKHVGLTLPVVADQAVELGGELQPRLGDVLVIDYGGGVQCHGAKVVLFSRYVLLKCGLNATFVTMMELEQLNFAQPVMGVNAFSTTRGQIDGRNPYSGVNLCDYVGDDALSVLDARITLAMQLGVDLDDLVMPRQTHSGRVAVIDEGFRSLDICRQEDVLEGVDALVTKLPGIVIGVNTADCVPIVLVDEVAGVIAVAHAGWRGTVGRIAEAVVDEMRRQGGRTERIQVVMGPSICQDCFEVGNEVVDAFSQAHFDLGAIVMRNVASGKAHIDLRAANRDVLVAAGVPVGNIVLSQHCSRCEHNRFFSARRLGINSGRTFTGIYRNI